MMKLEDCRYDGSDAFKIAEYPTSAKIEKAERSRIEELMAVNIDRMVELQDKLYAQGTEGLVIMIQAMDAAGKDGTIKHVMSGLNPQGVQVYSFKQPSKDELAHDYLWRAVCHLPKRGYIGLFNRSYYEDVLVVRVRGLWRNYAMPKRCLDVDEKSFFDQRYRQIDQLLLIILGIGKQSYERNGKNKRSCIPKTAFFDYRYCSFRGRPCQI